MTRSGGTWLAFALAVLAAGPAAAQDDPIGALLSAPEAQAPPAAPAEPAAADLGEDGQPVAAPAEPLPATPTQPSSHTTPEEVPAAPVQAAAPPVETQPAAAPQQAAPAPVPAVPSAPGPPATAALPPVPVPAAPPPAVAPAGLPTAPIPYQAIAPTSPPPQPPPAVAAAPYAPTPPATGAPYAPPRASSIPYPPATPQASAYATPPAYSPYPSPSMGMASAPPPSSTVRPTSGVPVNIDQRDRTPEGPLNPRELDYEQRLRASYASAQGLQGPLDGSWTLAVDGDDLYSLELVERSSGVLEGAWRDVRRSGAVNASGFVEDIQRYGGQLTLRFRPDLRQEAYTATLAAGADGRWTGEMVRGRDRKSVTLRRN